MESHGPGDAHKLQLKLRSSRGCLKAKAAWQTTGLFNKKSKRKPVHLKWLTMSSDKHKCVVSFLCQFFCVTKLSMVSTKLPAGKCFSVLSHQTSWPSKNQQFSKVWLGYRMVYASRTLTPRNFYEQISPFVLLAWLAVLLFISLSETPFQYITKFPESPWYPPTEYRKGPNKPQMPHTRIWQSLLSSANINSSGLQRYVTWPENLVGTNWLIVGFACYGFA